MIREKRDPMVIGDVNLLGLQFNYNIDHSEFESNSIEVFYMDYNFSTYTQPGLSCFDPYVTSLDYLCNTGMPESYVPKSSIINWRDALTNFSG